MIIDLKGLKEAARDTVLKTEQMVSRLASKESTVLSSQEKILLLAMATVFVQEIMHTISDLKESSVKLTPPSLN